jgi:EAL domain-containing protein (putative c-di-GMP-specific phosphodiesterase class I)/CheY-like chemotaxis protein
MKVLILDDDPFILKLLSVQLKGYGTKTGRTLELVTCERGSEAVALIEGNPEAFELVFCDLQMPEMDGVEFVRHLVRLRYGGAVVLVSGEIERIRQSAQRLAKAHGLRVLGALEKPVSLEHLQRLIDQTVPAAPASRQALKASYGPDELRRAIDEGELVNHYQPKVSLTTGQVVGVETLVRWQHPRDGLVLPGHFIAVAEQSGLITDLAKAVLPAALGQVRRWRDTGASVDVAVNVSMGNLESLDFPDFVARHARSAGVEPAALILEVTESQLAQDSRATLDILTRLRLKQVRLSIDDFGVGYSSLSQLRDLPFNELKVDRSFVDGIARDPSLQAILGACLAMARQLGLETVAEGVEEREDWDFLRRSGCELAQGYFIARPMAGEALPGWFESWQARRRELIA